MRARYGCRVWCNYVVRYGFVEGSVSATFPPPAADSLISPSWPSSGVLHLDNTRPLVSSPSPLPRYQHCPLWTPAPLSLGEVAPIVVSRVARRKRDPVPVAEGCLSFFSTRSLDFSATPSQEASERYSVSVHGY